MIGFISGKVKSIDEKSATILTMGGVGYKVFIPLSTLLSLNEDEELELLTHTVVKDDAIDLYGFVIKEELEMFEKLITVSGIGPRSALNILSVSSIQNIAIAVENGDANLLSGIPGLGKRSCEKIVIELKGKLAHFIKSSGESESIKDNILLEENDARLALSSLGYNEKDINKSVAEAKESIGEKFEKMQASEMIKEILKYLR